jgi:hypothetical protein
MKLFEKAKNSNFQRTYNRHMIVEALKKKNWKRIY